MEFRKFVAGKSGLSGSDSLTILGLSPNNSYYNRPNTRDQIRFAAENFDTIKVMIPSGPLVFNYIAQGHSDPELKAAERCIPLYKMAEEYSKYSNDIHVVNWEGEIAENHFFKEKLSDILFLLNEKTPFREDLLNLSQKVVGKHANMEIAMKYPAHEMAYILSAAQMYNVPSVTYIYKDSWEPLEKMIKGTYAIKAPNVSFAVVN